MNLKHYMKSLLLIHPKSPLGSVQLEMPQAGLAYIASSARKKGARVEILELNVEHLSLKQIIRKSSRFDIIGIYANEALIDTALKLASAIKSGNKESTTIIGGPSATINYKKLLSLRKNRRFLFDIACIGEGESTIVKILNGKNLSKIKGIAYRQKDKIIFTRISPDYSLKKDCLRIEIGKKFTWKKWGVKGKTIILSRNEIRQKILQKKTSPDWSNDNVICFEEYFDYSNIQGNVYISFRQEGLKYTPIGFTNQTSLKKIWINQKVPRLIRNKVPLFCDELGVIYPIGLRIADRLRISNETQSVLYLQGELDLTLDSDVY